MAAENAISPAEAERKRREELVAWAIYRGLRRRNRDSFVSEPERGRAVLIDGNFYLMAVARRVLKEMEGEALLVPPR